MPKSEQKSVEKQRHAARAVDQTGPGTAGQTISGAAYRGMEVASPGFSTERVGLHPGQGVGVDGTTHQRAADLSDQDLNIAAQPKGAGTAP
jgi:hypothetical protein